MIGASFPSLVALDPNGVPRFLWARATGEAAAIGCWCFAEEEQDGKDAVPGVVEVSARRRTQRRRGFAARV